MSRAISRTVRRLARKLVAPALAATVALGGCTTQPAGPHGAQSPAAVRRTPSGKPTQPNDLSDPCATRLHDISGLLLMYYAINRHLPEKLDDLSSLTDVDIDFRTECPVSHLPFVYVPHGIPAPGQQRLLLLYDATPAHGGLRWGVLAAPPHDGQPPATFVLLMSEEVFRSYVPATR